MSTISRPRLRTWTLVPVRSIHDWLNLHSALYSIANMRWGELQIALGLSPSYADYLRARAGELQMMRVVTAGDGYASQYSRVAHFGLGQASAVDELEVTVRNWGKVGERVNVLMQANEDKLVKTLDNLEIATRRAADLLGDDNQKVVREILKDVRTGSAHCASLSV